MLTANMSIFRIHSNFQKDTRHSAGLWICKTMIIIAVMILRILMITVMLIITIVMVMIIIIIQSPMQTIRIQICHCFHLIQ